MKRLLTYLALGLLSGSIFAAPLTPEQALERVNNSLPGTRSVDTQKLKFTKLANDGQPALYIFDNNNDQEGYMVLSADNLAAPLLGYTDNGAFDIDNLPPALENWLNQYTLQVEYLRENGIIIEKEPQTRADLPNWAPIKPLVKTQWNQGKPFNNLCPKSGNMNCYTGCVATAMSQVMKYFNYPERGRGSINYRPDGYAQSFSMDFSEAVFDWGNMINNYNGSYSAEEATAVATLMKAAGYSVQMSYSTNQSGAISGLIPGALMKYFDYDPSAMYVSRAQKSYTEWATLLYNNLKNVGPIIYDGDTASSGGHSFVCDGYQGDGYFHFNWGWGGMSDGYFLLDVLNPSGIGIGGALGGFNFMQDVVLNIQPNKGGTTSAQTSLILSGSVSEPSATDSYLTIPVVGSAYPGFRYYGDTAMTFTAGIAIQPADDTNATPQYVEVANNTLKNAYIDPTFLIATMGVSGMPYPMVARSKMNLQDNVKYKVTMAFQEIVDKVAGDWQILPCGYDCYNYFYMTKSGNTLSFESFEQPQFTCTELTPTGTVYFNVATQFNISLTNNSNGELTRGVTLILFNEKGTAAFQSDSFVITLSPGETYSDEWLTALNAIVTGKVSTETPFYPALYDIDTNTYYYRSETPIMMQPNPGVPDFELSLTVDDSELVKNTYYVDNATDFNVTTTLNVTEGVFSYPIDLVIMEQYNSRELSILQTYQLPLAVIEGGTTQDFTMHVNFNTAEVGKIYYLGLVVNNSGELAIPEVPFTVLSNIDTGVESIIGGAGEIMFIYDKAGRSLKVAGGKDGIANVEAYTLNGMKAGVAVNYYGEGASVDLSSLGKGIVMVTATDKGGNRKAIKLAM